MKICGIVAEYNPFHRGHAHQLAAVHRAWGEDCALVCCMSGDFVQRGEAAVLPKHARARAAVREGADLVLELPALMTKTFIFSHTPVCFILLIFMLE